MKKLILATIVAAGAATAQAAVTYNFSGTEFDGAAVTGSVTIDTDALAGIDPAALTTGYYFATGDATSNAALPFLTVSFTSLGSNPALLTSAQVTYQSLLADLDTGQLALELDHQSENGDGTVTSSAFTLSGFALTSTAMAGGVLLPDFMQAGTVYFSARSGTGAQETFDIESSGQISFADAGAVPEASTWAMMVLGFGAVGYAARRRTSVRFAA